MSSVDPDAALATFPQCGSNCLGEAIASFSNCSISDPACVCPNKAVQDGAGACILRSCTAREILVTQNISNTLCGVVPNDENYFVPFLYAFIITSSVLVFLRFISRLHKGAGLWWDDWSILASVLGCIGWTTLCLMFRTYGAGRDVWSVAPDDLDTVLRLFYISFFFYAITRCLVRVSIILFLLRVFSVSGAKRLILTTLFLNVSLSVAFVGALIFQCTPINYFWLHWDGLQEGHCIDQWALLLVAGILAILFDVFILLLPIRWVFQLQFSLFKKITTAVMLSLGLVVIVASAERIIALRQFLHGSNVTANFPLCVIWAGLDIHVAIICACLPSLKTTLSVVSSRFKDWTTKGSSWVSSRGNQKSSSSSDNLQGKNEQGLENSRQITMTTIIRQHNGPPSNPGPYVPLQDIELNNYQKGSASGQAWA